VVSLSSSTKLTVNDDKVVLKDGINNQGVSTACTIKTDSNTGMIQCSTVLSVTAGEATKLTCSGAGVMLKNLAGTTNGNDNSGQSPAISCKSTGQTKLAAS